MDDYLMEYKILAKRYLHKGTFFVGISAGMKVKL